MREILFKAKRIDNGEWVEGYYTYHRIGFEYPEGDGKHCIRDTREYPGKLYFIDENTLCQYTGLTDKNGNKIWENDIVKYHFGEDIAVIRYGKYQSCFDSQKACHVGFYVNWQKGYMRKDLGYWVEMIDCNVIGNIFDNPELLN